MQYSKVSLLVFSIIAAKSAIANPFPQPVPNVARDVATSELAKRTTCWLNYLPACCSFLTWTSWPSIQPGLSSGCVTMASQPGGVCPTSGPSSQACCQEYPFGGLWYQPDRRVYCYGV